MRIAVGEAESRAYSRDRNDASVYDVDACEGSNLNEEVSLRSLEVGQRAQVMRVNGTGELGRRIREMGIIPGVKVSVVGRAPLKDPVALRVLDFILTLRNNEADFITVKIIR